MDSLGGSELILSGISRIFGMPSVFPVAIISAIALNDCGYEPDCARDSSCGVSCDSVCVSCWSLLLVSCYARL